VPDKRSQVPSKPHPWRRGFLWTLLLIQLLLLPWLVGSVGSPPWPEQTPGLDTRTEPAPPGGPIHIEQPLLFTATPGTPLPSPTGDPVHHTSSQHGFSFRFPKTWTLSVPESPPSKGSALLLQSPSQQSVAILLLSVATTADQAEDMLDFIEYAYLSPHYVVPSTTRNVMVDGQPLPMQEFLCQANSASGPLQWRAAMTTIRSPDRVYVVFLRGLPAEFEEALPVYRRVLSSFHRESPPTAGGDAESELTLLARSSFPFLKGHQSVKTLQGYLASGRDGNQRVEEVVRLLGIRPGQTVADVGAGSGYFSWHLSRAVGPSGRVVALDINANAIRFLVRRLQTNPPPHPNIDVLWSHTADCGLAAGSVDLAFACAAHFYLENDPHSRECLKTLRRAVKPGGRLAIIEGKVNETHRAVPLRYLQEQLLRASFEIDQVHDLFRDDHFVIFR